MTRSKLSHVRARPQLLGPWSVFRVSWSFRPAAPRLQVSSLSYCSDRFVIGNMFAWACATQVTPRSLINLFCWLRLRRYFGSQSQASLRGGRTMLVCRNRPRRIVSLSWHFVQRAGFKTESSCNCFCKNRIVEAFDTCVGVKRLNHFRRS